MAIKYKLNMGPFKKYVTCIMASHSTLSHFDTFTFSLPRCLLLNFTKKLQNERKEEFLNIWLLHRITLYQKR